jgi:hypothetical protein
MRKTAYVAVLMFSPAALLAFATAPAIAQMTPGSMMEQSEKVLQHKGQHLLCALRVLCGEIFFCHLTLENG